MARASLASVDPGKLFLFRDNQRVSWHMCWMKLIRLTAAFFAAATCILTSFADSPPAKPAEKNGATTANNSTNEVAVLKTSEGEMVVQFWPDVAPKTVENFKKLGREKFYDGTKFHRIIKGFMIQGGDPLSRNDSPEVGTGGPGYMIKAEFNSRPHVRGVLSMARSRSPDSAGSQFFICLDDASNLNNQYTAFGKLIRGEDVLMKIGNTPVGPSESGERSKPLKSVVLESVKIVPAESIK
jgi:peptidyl-prolyl cis-trans isomerase B (cyclophilin B)